MKFVFFGNAEFSVAVLEKLIDAGFIPTAVVCGPDKPAGRKKIITSPPVKSRILNLEDGIKNGIKILQPERLDPALFFIPNSSFDLFIVAAYPKIIPQEILDIPRLGTIGVHPSLLPRLRGAAPIQSAILHGDPETGTTLFLMDEKVDHGGIVSSIKYQVSSEENYETLLERLAKLSGDLLVKTLPDFLEGKITPQPQDESQATYTKKFATEDGYVDSPELEKAQRDGGETAILIERKIRALNPEPGVWTMQGGKRIKLLEAKIIDGKLKLIKIQKEGKNPIDLTKVNE